MSGDTFGEVVVLVLCALLAAAASGTETALTSVGRLRIRHLAEDGNRRAVTLQRLHEDPNRMLSTVLVINTLALILASAATTLLGIRYLPKSWGVLGTFLADLLLTLLLLVFAEVTPKTLAIRNAERVALATAGAVDAVATALRPVLWFITLVSRGITGGRAARGPYLTEEELIHIVQFSEEQGVIEEEEREMIAGIIEIGDKLVREVMVPRTDITAVERNAKIEDVVELIRTHGHSRIPVYEGDLDHIVGMVLAKDVLLRSARGERDVTIEQLLRPIQFVPESKKVDELLHEMQEANTHMVAVVDEYGGTAGIVTHEDLLEEIVGEIRDEYDVAEEEPLTLISEREALVDARFPMEELNEKLNLGIEESEEYDSVGGYVYSALGSIPQVGASFEGGRATWSVEQVNGQRILRVRVSAEEPWPDPVLVEFGMNPPDRDSKTPPAE
ncbi:MAG TPA: hemolysin family protein [Candidatus Dormibacteraeota bacterium]